MGKLLNILNSNITLRIVVFLEVFLIGSFALFYMMLLWAQSTFTILEAPQKGIGNELLFWFAWIGPQLTSVLVSYFVPAGALRPLAIFLAMPVAGLVLNAGLPQSLEIFKIWPTTMLGVMGILRD